jgi:AcrR family transcriptional regulator
MARTGTRASATERRRRDLLRAALDCFVSLGYARATMRAVRVRARASTGSLYYHFVSKEDLAAALYLDGIRAAQEFRLKATSRQRSAQAKIRTFVSAYLEWVGANPKLANYLLNMRHAEFMTPAERGLRQLNQEFEAQVRAMMQPHLEGGEIRVLSSDLYRAVLTGPSDQFARQWLIGQTQTDLERAGRFFGDVAWNALRAAPAVRNVAAPARKRASRRPARARMNEPTRKRRK